MKFYLLRLKLIKHSFFRYLISIFFLFLIGFSSVFAQDDCTYTLTRAQKMFDAGVIEQIPGMLQSCLGHGFTDEENIQAYKLIISAYVFDGNKQDAEKLMQTFLKKYPEYEVTATDHAEFVQLFQSFRSIPVVSIGLKGGINSTYAKVLESYSVRSLNEAKGEYTSSTGFQAGLSLSFYLFNQIDLNVEGNYILQSTSQYTNSAAHNNIKETRTFVDIPVSVIYSYPIGRKFVAFARLGPGLRYLLTDNIDGTRENLNESSKPFTGASFSIIESRNLLNIYATAGTGLKYKIKGGAVIFDIRYNYNFMREEIDSKRYSGNWDLPFYYNYIDSKYKISNLWFNLGYVHTFYKPKKKI